MIRCVHCAWTFSTTTHSRTESAPYISVVELFRERIQSVCVLCLYWFDSLVSFSAHETNAWHFHRIDIHTYRFIYYFARLHSIHSLYFSYAHVDDDTLCIVCFSARTNRALRWNRREKSTFRTFWWRNKIEREKKSLKLTVINDADHRLPMWLYIANYKVVATTPTRVNQRIEKRDKTKMCM